MIPRKIGIALLLAGATGGWGREPQGELRLHGLFTDGMVLQRDAPCPVWGTAPAGEPVSVTIAGETRETRAGADGRWSVTLDPLAAGGPYRLQVNQLTLQDVLVGEVWVAAGGQNMNMPLRDAQIGKTEPDDDPVAMVRYFTVPRHEMDDPQHDLDGGQWRSNRSEAVADASAVAYFFARALHKGLGVPVGFIQATSDSGTTEAWMSKNALDSTPGLREFTLYTRLNEANFAAVNARYLESVQEAEKARKKGLPVPPILPKPVKPDGTSLLYNGMIAPLMPFAIRGVILYQGELESWRAARYRKLLSGWIQTWRSEWGQPEMPFGYVQLSSLGPRTEEPQDTALPRFRDAQLQTLQMPNTGMAVTVDIGDPTTNLPRNKEEVGRRLALWARARTYGQSDLVYSGPLYESMKIEQNKVRIRFKNVGSGLQARGEKITGFAMASDFRKFFWANAVIEGDTVVVSCDDVRWPAAVRYAYSDNPDCNLYNKEGLPASPFRTDNW